MRISSKWMELQVRIWLVPKKRAKVGGKGVILKTENKRSSLGSWRRFWGPGESRAKRKYRSAAQVCQATGFLCSVLISLLAHLLWCLGQMTSSRDDNEMIQAIMREPWTSESQNHLQIPPSVKISPVESATDFPGALWEWVNGYGMHTN